MRPILLAFVLLVNLIAVSGRAEDQPKPGPEHKALRLGLGEWTYLGVAHESPFGPAGKFQGRDSNRLILDGFFVETHWEDRSDTGFLAKGVVIRGYDAARKVYTATAYENDGSVTTDILTLDGKTWTTSGSRTASDGKVYKVRNSIAYADDERSFNEKSEFSADGGQTWKVYYEMTAKKAKK